MTEVNTKDGIVTLKGDADNQAQKDLTTEYAKDVEGVKDVQNEMVVAKTAKKTSPYGGRKGSDVGEKIDDASITALVKRRCCTIARPAPSTPRSMTKHGVVTLTGKAENASAKELATKFVKDVHGVKSVNNQMTIEGSK